MKHRNRSGDGGSITIEAALVLPLFISFALLLVGFIQFTMAETALKSAVNETAKQAAAHYYPFYILLQSSEMQTTVQPIQNVIEKLPHSWQEILKEKGNKAVEPVFLPLLRSYANESVLKLDRLNVTEVRLPDFSEQGRGWFVIGASYEFRLLIPFFSRSVMIKKKAVERVWVGKVN